MIGYSSAALLLSTIGCVCIYLASPNQRWLAAPLPRWPACVAGLVLCVLGWIVLAQGMSKLAASFLFVTAIMFILAVLPYLGAVRSIRTGANE